MNEILSVLIASLERLMDLVSCERIVPIYTDTSEYYTCQRHLAGLVKPLSHHCITYHSLRCLLRVLDQGTVLGLLFSHHCGNLWHDYDHLARILQVIGGTTQFDEDRLVCKP